MEEEVKEVKDENVQQVQKTSKKQAPETTVLLAVALGLIAIVVVSVFLKIISG